MDSRSEFDDARLSRIETLWSVVRQAHLSDRDDASAAQQQLLTRYGGAIRRYLVGALRNDDLADDLFQEFAFKFLRGEFKAADPERGRFRSFVKTVLFRMVALHFRKQSSRKEKHVEHLPADAAEDGAPADELFLDSWREDLLSRTWDAMATHEMTGGPPFNTILRIRVENPAADSAELAGLISAALGKEISGGNARVQVHRAREKFANLMIETVTESLENPSRENVESELVELRLIDYCRQSLDSHQGTRGGGGKEL